MDKKASGYFLGIMVILIGALVLLSFTGKIFSSTPDVDGENCRLLIGLKGTQSKILGDSINLIKKNCQTNYQSIPGSQRISNPDHLKKLFADKIERAWFIVHEGTVKAMWDPSVFGRFGTEDKQCVILYALTYEGKTRRDYVVSLKDFETFAATETAVKQDDNTWTLTQYIQSYGAPAHLVLIPKNVSQEARDEFLKSGNVYAIAVASKTKNWWNNRLFRVAFTLLNPLAIPGSKGTIGRELLDYVYEKNFAGPEPTELSGDSNIVFFGDFDTIKSMGCEEITPESET